MFNDAAHKLKTFAQTLFVLNVIAFVILAVVFGCPDFEDFEPIPFFLLIIGGPVVSYFECLTLYAIGEAAESVKEIKRFIKKNGLSEKETEDEEKGGTSDNLITSVKKKKSEEDKFFVCPVCGKKQPKRAGASLYCWECGAKFSDSNISESSMSKVKPIKSEEEGFIVCPLCGKKQPKGVKYCWECNAKFDD